MNILSLLKDRFQSALAGMCDDAAPLWEMIRPAQDAQFGDYQANCAMPLAKQIGRSPREIAAQIVERLDVADFCEPPEIAGPGFINLRLKSDWLAARLRAAAPDERLGVSGAAAPRTFVIDFSSPNVAKPMHVGHIRSTVIGDSLCRTLRFLGHTVIGDNHLGDWGTQFGMIIYGYKHFRDQEAYERDPVGELGRLYKLVNRLVEFQAAKAELPNRRQSLEQAARQLAAERESGGEKKSEKSLRRLESKVKQEQDALAALLAKIEGVEAEPEASARAAEHSDIEQAVLRETAALHEGDETNRRLWEEFLPNCRADIHRIYDRLGITFDHELGESFYQGRLASIVADFAERGLARESDGAMCVFIEGFNAPMIIRKRDGAFLYATTDLATIQYRMENWRPDAILYVVDHRQSGHFQMLFAAARLWGCAEVDLRHISFGTVLGRDGRPYRTRSGAAETLEGLIDEAVAQALAAVSRKDDDKAAGPELSDVEREEIARVIGPGAIKYADLSQNRTSDYKFDIDKMVAFEGNTATYMQYCYTRTQSIFRKGEVNVSSLRGKPPEIVLDHPAERALALKLLRLEEALLDLIVDFRPNLLTDYLFDLAKDFSTFFEQCPVLKAESESLKNSRLLLCDFTGRTIRRGLGLLGIDVVERM